MTVWLEGGVPLRGNWSRFFRREVVKKRYPDVREALSLELQKRTKNIPSQLIRSAVPTHILQGIKITRNLGHSLKSPFQPYALLGSKIG